MMSKYHRPTTLLIFISLLWFTSPSYAQIQMPPYSIVFGVQDTGQSSMNIRYLDLATLEQHILVEDAASEYLAQSPNGRFIVFENYHTERCVNTCMYDMETATITGLSQNFRPPRCKACTSTGDFRSPSSIMWSPNSDEFAFATWYAEPSGIYIFNLNSQMFRLFRQYDSFSTGIPSWSPDGRRLSIMWYDRQLETYDVESASRIESLWGNNYFIGDTGANWSPSGAYLAVSGLGVYVIDSKLKKVMNLTPEQKTVINDESIYFRTMPQWLPDESTLIVEGVTYGSSPSSYIYSIDIKTLKKRILSEGTQPQLSPDGEWIVFVGTRQLDNDIYIMRSDGSDLQQITKTSETELFPQWNTSRG